MRTTTMSSQESNREHLFISYASEDWLLARWISLKLASLGYKVWCDRIKLLGGESYPIDIDHAIKNSTFRVLSLLSRNSKDKPNPVKERTLALSIASERKVDFLIPINVDGLLPSELPWMTSDLVFIPFHHSWAAGLNQLQEKLTRINAPKTFENGMLSVAQWLSKEDYIVKRPERLRSNIVPLLTVPQSIVQYSVYNKPNIETDRWPFYYQNDSTVWAFGPPPSNSAVAAIENKVVDWHEIKSVDNIDTINIVTSLVRNCVIVNCLNRGLRFSTDKLDLYFPQGIVPKDQLHYANYDGKKTYILCVGQRRIRHPETDQIETSNYHLSPVIDPIMSRFGVPSLQINLRLFFTNLQGFELSRGRANRRRKRVTKFWYNKDWLARITAIHSWMMDGKSELTLFDSKYGKLMLGNRSIEIASPNGIDENALEAKEPIQEDNDSVVVEEPVEDGDDYDEEESGEEDRNLT